MTTTTRGSTRHIVVDERFCGLLHEDHPQIPLPTIEAALMGRPQRQAMVLCGWAEAKTSDPAAALAGWAAKYPVESPREPRDGTTGEPQAVYRILRHPAHDQAVSAAYRRHCR